jgi:hypothetical protein
VHQKFQEIPESKKYFELNNQGLTRKAYSEIKGVNRF